MLDVSLAEPRLLIVREDIFQYRRGSAGLLDVYNKSFCEDTESESVEEPDNQETTQRQPALNTSTVHLAL